MKQLKNRLASFNSEIYKLTATNLYTLKSSLFAEFIMAIDELEVDLGIQPQYFSDKVIQIIDEFFKHFVTALNLDLVKFSQLMLSQDMKRIRLQHFERMQKKLRDQQ